MCEKKAIKNSITIYILIGSILGVNLLLSEFEIFVRFIQSFYFFCLFVCNVIFGINLIITSFDYGGYSYNLYVCLLHVSIFMLFCSLLFYFILFYQCIFYYVMFEVCKFFFISFL